MSSGSVVSEKPAQCRFAVVSPGDVWKMIVKERGWFKMTATSYFRGYTVATKTRTSLFVA